MTTEILIAVITAVASVVSVIITNRTTLAVMNNKLENLTEEVKKHNNFASRLPVLEEKVNNLERRIDEK